MKSELHLLSNLYMKKLGTHTDDDLKKEPLKSFWAKREQELLDAIRQYSKIKSKKVSLTKRWFDGVMDCLISDIDKEGGKLALTKETIEEECETFCSNTANVKPACRFI